jgi:hypothetical protein
MTSDNLAVTIQRLLRLRFLLTPPASTNYDTLGHEKSSETKSDPVKKLLNSQAMLCVSSVETCGVLANNPCPFRQALGAMFCPLGQQPASRPLTSNTAHLSRY